MIEFKQIEITDKDILKPVLTASGRMACDYSFGNAFAWAPVYSTQYAKVGDLVLMRTITEDYGYIYPLGQGNLKGVIEELIVEHPRLRFNAMTREQCGHLEEMFPGRFEFSVHRDYCDYLYSSEKLITLGGKKLHGKRNHINKFKALHPDFVYEPITRENLPECYAMNEEWLRQNAGDAGIQQEHTAVQRFFDHYFDLELQGALIRVDGRVVAYTMGEPINERVFDTHLEKAFYDVQGAYAIINQQFAEHVCKDYEFINREEDLGEEGLRKAKTSYQPEILLEKWYAVLK